MMVTFIKNSCLWAALFLMVWTARAQTVAKPYEVGTWEDFRQSAVTWTFDDGNTNQFAKAVPLFDKLGFKGTFFTVTSWSPQWMTLKQILTNVKFPYSNSESCKIQHLQVSDQI